MREEQESTIDPERDPRLRAALADAFGEQPRDVDWSALAHRTRSAALFRLRARARQTPWWELAGRWSRRALPVGLLAAAAAVLLALFTPRATDATPADRASVAEIVTSASPAQAVRTVAASPLDETWLWGATVGTDAANSTTGAQ
ncbi:MAG TPA: hypothetical protein VF761_01485 [Gemmatimonadaceae bacterium]